MKKIKITAGIIWGFAALLLMLALFPNLTRFSRSLAGMPFMKINPNFTGGEISRKYTTGNCTIAVHTPVFEGLLKERRNGFVQVDWRGRLPEEITDTIDYNLDNNADFIIHIDRTNNKTELNALRTNVHGVDLSTPVSYGWAARIKIGKSE